MSGAAGKTASRHNLLELFGINIFFSCQLYINGDLPFNLMVDTPTHNTVNNTTRGASISTSPGINGPEAFRESPETR